MIAVRVFDPAMCCSTGVCGPSVDPQLVRFSADLDWLKSQGVSVERFNLSQQPGAFAEDAAVKAALEAKGEAGLPLVKVNGEVRSSGVYPSRDELAAWAGVGSATSPSAPKAKKAGGCCGAEAEGGAQKKAGGCCGAEAADGAQKKAGGCCGAEAADGAKAGGCCGAEEDSAEKQAAPAKSGGCCGAKAEDAGAKRSGCC
jgi:hypothetical protein